MGEAPFIHPQALVEPGAKVGARTRVWAFAHLLPGARVGEDCNICDHVFIENDVAVGDRVTIKCGVQLWDAVVLEDDVFVGPNATFTNDRFPRSRRHPPAYLPTVVRSGASIGANATILAGITIGRNAMVGAGAVVTKDVPANAVVVGNPARIKGYVTGRERAPGGAAAPATPSAGQGAELDVRGVRQFELPLVADLRGSLSFAEVERHLPFAPRRYFVVFDVQSEKIRGEHAHRRLHQFLVCLKGSCTVMVDDGERRAEVVLNRPTLGLWVPPMVWAAQYHYSPDALLLVLASEPYDAAEYIRDYDVFLAEVRASSGPGRPA
ncbi:MAG TPA: WxcM-like domain-containing protein [Candidatus Paceibacterota bacterium]|nr:WxcM-like domain-containing protein [Verrucomicrobiota bacterium]HOX01344.1 WxcM-like domain-containing protein [Verrucomicrobiota bacterium]HRZ46508.1 WxcM-like domain-containing protein [Candidatus Paceibacterota bacterium]HRZ93069.1 WxcM-like domain-containing protein [Candidatus Paceibacterota bacterium]